MKVQETSLKKALKGRNLYVVTQDEGSYVFTEIDEFIKSAGCAIVEMEVMPEEPAKDKKPSLSPKTKDIEAKPQKVLKKRGRPKKEVKP